jgi:hypothetical protein
MVSTVSGTTEPADMLEMALISVEGNCVLGAHHNIHGVPAAKVHYHTILANVDWLHGLAESNLTITNLLIGTLPPFSLWL